MSFPPIPDGDLTMDRIEYRKRLNMKIIYEHKRLLKHLSFVTNVILLYLFYRYTVATLKNIFN